MMLKTEKEITADDILTCLEELDLDVEVSYRDSIFFRIYFEINGFLYWFWFEDNLFTWGSYISEETGEHKQFVESDGLIRHLDEQLGKRKKNDSRTI